jgi:hypothetical protein
MVLAACSRSGSIQVFLFLVSKEVNRDESSKKFLCILLTGLPRSCASWKEVRVPTCLLNCDFAVNGSFVARHKKLFPVSPPQSLLPELYCQTHRKSCQRPKCRPPFGVSVEVFAEICVHSQYYSVKAWWQKHRVTKERSGTKWVENRIVVFASRKTQVKGQGRVKISQLRDNRAQKLKFVTHSVTLQWRHWPERTTVSCRETGAVQCNITVDCKLPADKFTHAH